MYRSRIKIKDEGLRMKDETKPQDIRERTFNFAVEIIKFCGELPKNDVNRILIRQVIRSGTSIGANLEEAQGANTRPEFTNCTNIAKKEARETNYWLRLIAESNNQLAKQKIERLIKESEEISKILTTIVKKLKNRNDLKLNP